MKIKSLQILGLLGLGGAVLMFNGDMCSYGHFGSGGDSASSLHSVISNISDAQIFVGGFIGPIAAILYCLGFFHVYKVIFPKSRILSLIIAGGAAAMVVFGGTYHAMWSIRALMIKAGLFSAPYHGFYSQTREYTSLFYNTMLTIAGIASLLLLFAVLSRRSLYPRWTAIVNPGFLFFIF
jgi:hypothetical protein